MPAYVPPHLRRRQQELEQQGQPQQQLQGRAQQQHDGATQPEPQHPVAATAGAPSRKFQTRGRGPVGDWHPLDEPQPAAAAARARRQGRLQEHAQQPQPHHTMPSPTTGDGPSRRLASTSTAAAVQRVADLDVAVASLMVADKRIGFPDAEPAVEPNSHGWFFPPHRVVMSTLMSTETSCVLELGSWLGKSTRFIAQRAPNAYIFAVDLWDNEHIRADPHYTDHGGESAFMAHKVARARQIQENLRIIDTAPIYDVFLKNLWAERPALGDAHTSALGRAPGSGGVVPMKMCCKDAIELLARAGIVPDTIYVDASHHYDDVLQDITMCLQRFPSARICGDDWDYPPVQRAAVDAAAPLGLTVCAEGGKCWVYGSISQQLLASARKEFYGDQESLSQESLALFSAVERCVSSPGDNVDGLFDILDQPYLDQGGKRSIIVNTGFPPKGRTMLMVAAMQGKVGCVQLLLEEMGADPDVATVSKGETALHLAAFGGQYEVVSALLKNGASVALVNEYNETAEQSALAASKVKRKDATDVSNRGGSSGIARDNGDSCMRCMQLIAQYRTSREAGNRDI